MLREGIERFPTAFLDQDAAEIRLLCDHRDSLVNERTRLINSHNEAMRCLERHLARHYHRVLVGDYDDVAAIRSLNSGP